MLRSAVCRIPRCAHCWRDANSLLTDRQQLLDSAYEHDAEVQPPRSRAAARTDPRRGQRAVRRARLRRGLDRGHRAAPPASRAGSCTTTSAVARRSTSRCSSGSAPSARNELRPPVGRSARARVADSVSRWLDWTEANRTIWLGHDRARRGHRRPRRQARGRRPRAPRRRAAHDFSRRHRRGLAAAAPRARVLDRAQPRRDATLAARRGHPRGDARAARLDARTRPTHVRRPTRAKPAHSSSLTANYRVPVVSFTLAGHFSLVGRSSIGPGRTELIGRGTDRAAGSLAALSEQEPHLGHVVLGHRRR